jgi:hypothetical protein
MSSSDNKPFAVAAAMLPETAKRAQRLHVHHDVGAVRFQPRRQFLRAVLALPLVFDDRQRAAQLPRPPQRQRRLPARHDATTDQRRRWVSLGDRGGDALDPIGRRNGVIVDVRNVTAARGLRANVARQADPRLLDTLQPGM